MPSAVGVATPSARRKTLINQSLSVIHDWSLLSREIPLVNLPETVVEASFAHANVNWTGAGRRLSRAIAPAYRSSGSGALVGEVRLSEMRVIITVWKFSIPKSTRNQEVVNAKSYGNKRQVINNDRWQCDNWEVQTMTSTWRRFIARVTAHQYYPVWNSATESPMKVIIPGAAFIKKLVQGNRVTSAKLPVSSMYFGGIAPFTLGKVMHAGPGKLQSRCASHYCANFSH